MSFQRSRPFFQVALVLLCLGSLAYGQPSQPRQRKMAITFDDLPVAQSGKSMCQQPGLTELTQKLLKPFIADAIPLTAFVITNNCSKVLSEAERAKILKLWLDAGVELGNHTYSHRGLNNMSIEEYETDILRADADLKRMLGLKQVRYFRSPMLQTGATKEKKEQLEQFLKAKSYEQAVVTIDNAEWIFANVYSKTLEAGKVEHAQEVQETYVSYMDSVVAYFEKRSIEVLGHEPPQILLLHANRLNANASPELIGMLKKRGYAFVDLKHALSDAAYQSKNEYVGPKGFSWLHRWAITRGMPESSEPEPPTWIMQEFGASQ